MGEIAEMMLDGTLCEGCGVYIGRNSGHPEMCPSCLGVGKNQVLKPAASAKPKITCGICNKRVKVAGLVDHLRVAHGWK